MAFFERTKTGRLKYPKAAVIPYDEENPTVFETGEFVVVGNSISAGTVGRVIDVDNQFQYFNPHVNVELLDGKTGGGWDWFCKKIPPEAVQEVKDFYIKDGRPERIKVTW